MLDDLYPSILGDTQQSAEPTPRQLTAFEQASLTLLVKRLLEGSSAYSYFATESADKAFAEAREAAGLPRLKSRQEADVEFQLIRELRLNLTEFDALAMSSYGGTSIKALATAVVCERLGLDQESGPVLLGAVSWATLDYDPAALRALRELPQQDRPYGPAGALCCELVAAKLTSAMRGDAYGSAHFHELHLHSLRKVVLELCQAQGIAPAASDPLLKALLAGISSSALEDLPPEVLENLGGLVLQSIGLDPVSGPALFGESGWARLVAAAQPPISSSHENTDSAPLQSERARGFENLKVATTVSIAVAGLLGGLLALPSGLSRVWAWLQLLF